MQLLRKVVRVGTSKAVVIPSEVFESLATKGKTFTTVMVHLNEKIIIEPILEDIKKKEV